MLKNSSKIKKPVSTVSTQILSRKKSKHAGIKRKLMTEIVKTETPKVKFKKKGKITFHTSKPVSTKLEQKLNFSRLGRNEMLIC